MQIRLFLSISALIIQIFLPKTGFGKTYPKHLHMQQVSVKEIEKLIKRAKDDKSVRVKYHSLTGEPKNHRDFLAAKAEKDRSEEEDQSSSSSIWNPKGGVDGEGALLLFAIIGAVVVVAFVVYGAYYLTKPSTYLQPLFRLGIFARSIGENHSDSIKANKRDGKMTGISFDLLGRNHTQVSIGLNFELGMIEVTEKRESQLLRSDKGAFALLGPSVVFGKDIQIFLHLTSGKANLKQSGLVAQTKAGLRVPIPTQAKVLPSLGVSIGSLYLDKDYDQGLTKTPLIDTGRNHTESPFHYTATIDIGLEGEPHPLQ